MHPRHSCRWEDNIRMNIREVGWYGGDWMHVAQCRDHWQAFVNTLMNLQVGSYEHSNECLGAIKGREFHN